MSSDEEYDYSDNGDYDDEDMIDGTQDDDSAPSDNDMDLDGEDYPLASKGKKKAFDVPFDTLSQSSVQKLMTQDVEHISGIFGVDVGTAALLLRHLSWNKERLIENYMDKAASVSAAAGISAPEPEQSIPKPSRSRASPSSTRRTARRSTTPKADTTVCPICFDDEPESTLSLCCDHAFCTGCWDAYVTSKIKDEAEHSVRCMAEGCAIVAPDAFIENVLKDDPQTLTRFQDLLARHFVACNSNLKFCPYPSCTNTVQCNAASSKSSLTTLVPTVVCSASPSHRFCFGCPVDSDHRPVVCAVAKNWLKKCADDSETANWIKTNTKECVKCQSTIEKNGGCNHMTCKKCKWEFCWVCMGPWTEHGTAWYSCNRFEEKTGIDARDAQSKSRASLERYLHYYSRWANHEQSAKLSVELYVKTEKKMEEMQITSSLTWIEVQFMKKAVDEVEKCRMTLKWTYAMAFYLAKGNEKELFEDNQRDLEKAVEDLSELLEGAIDPEGIPALRQHVTDKTVYVQKRNEIVLEDTAAGFLDGRWKWNVTVDGFDDPEEE